MIGPGFIQRLQEIQTKKNSRVCVGLDPDLERLPSHLLERFGAADAVLAFTEALVASTHDVVCAYKLNLAFFEVLGERYWETVRRTVASVPEGVLVIADGKRGDIGNSARLYAEAAFERWDFDACTVSPYMGRDSVEPFLQYAGRAVFVLVRTSNPGAHDFQTIDAGGMPLYERVGRTVLAWERDNPGDLGFVMGATEPAAIRSIREFAPHLPLLIPGIGAQGGDAGGVLNAAGSGPILINSSRRIIYASGGIDFAEAARQETQAMRTLTGPPGDGA